jgi:peroxiredoxin
MILAFYGLAMKTGGFCKGLVRSPMCIRIIFKVLVMKKKLLTTLSITAFLCISQLAFAVEAGKAMPDCSLSSIDESQGQSSNLNQYKGNVIYVDFWASWCIPCVKSFPFLNEMHQQLKGQGLQIVGVNLDENKGDAKAFLAKYPANFMVMADVSKQCAKDFDVKAMPSSYLIDRKGIVHHVHLGFRPGEAKEMKQIVEKLLSDKAVGL